MRNRSRALLAVWALVVTAPAATAAPRPDITSVDTSEFPLVSVTTVTSSPVRDLEAFTVSQDGAPRPVAWARSAQGPLQLALVIDMSRHMRDDLRAAAASATELLLRLPDDTEVSLVSAAGDVEGVIERSPDIAAVIAALADARAGGDPALLQAIPVAVELLSTGPAGRRAVVVIAGAVDGDPAQIEEVARLLRETGVSLFGLALGGDLLEDLARAAGGSVRRVDRIAEPHAGLRRVADDLANLYQIDFIAYGGDAPTVIGVGIGQRPAHHASVTVTLLESDGGGTAVHRSATGDPSRTPVWALVVAITIVAAVTGASWLLHHRRVAVTGPAHRLSDREVHK